MSYDFGCSNCHDMMMHMVYRNRNPFTDQSCTFCNSCSNEYAKRNFNKMQRIYKLNKALSVLQCGRYT